VSGEWHCKQLPNGNSPIVVCERETLQAEVERLRAERDDHKARLAVEAVTAPDADYDTMMDSLQARIRDMWAEIERLRADLDAERALSDELHRALCVSALHLSDREVAKALAAYREAQRERNRGQAVS
jgi:uncharacterized small protein (DUF1192 family)